jgi:type III secretion protein R
MNDTATALLPLIVVTAAVGLIPFLVITTTAFLKISVVLFLIRNALGTQQTPPSLVLYAIAIVLTAYVSAPLVSEIYGRLTAPDADFNSIAGLRAISAAVVTPLRGFLKRFTNPQESSFLLAAAQRIWPPDFYRAASTDDLLIVIPAFVISELTRAFEIGFLLYLPFIAVDLIVSNVLMAMGMVMVSPLVISTPFKIFLFVLVSGWTRLLHGLVLSYAGG